ncbi:MAG: hypothetical protein BWY31_03662 [Lentisphaerae bacterium ADurb.Bin242]|nr:MAG: hypothetical protein BWY31_03662 [Lentisphaerae bacterium ADurb.Bin242]
MLNLNSLWKMIGRVGAAALFLLVLNGCIAYPVIGYRKYTPEFTGKVTARDGTPVSGMKVQVKCYNCFWEGQTNANGVFRVTELGHWYYFVVERLNRIDIYPKQIERKAIYDFFFRFGKGDEKDFAIGVLHNSPSEDFFYIPAFGGFLGFDLLTCKYVDPKVQDVEYKKKFWTSVQYDLSSNSQYFNDFLNLPSGRIDYYRKTYLLLKKEDLKGFKIITDDYVLTLDEVLFDYLFEFRKF